jgi:hypothetical protein
MVESAKGVCMSSRIRVAALLALISCLLVPTAGRAAHNTPRVAICVPACSTPSPPAVVSPDECMQSCAANKPTPIRATGVDVHTVRHQANRWLLRRYAGWRLARTRRTATLRCAREAVGYAWTCTGRWRSSGRARVRTLTLTRYQLDDGTTRVEMYARPAAAG